MRQLASIQTIAERRPIEGADAIEAVRVKDWWCVAKKGEFNTGDHCVYFEIDSLLPVSNPAFGFLSRGSKPKTMTIEAKTYIGYRLRTVKLRGQLSQGLALPLSKFEISPVLPPDVGEDVSEQLGVVKYEPPLPAQLAGKVKGMFPGFIPKTDEERVQNLGNVVERHQGELFFITEKLDGSSATYYRHTTTNDGDHFGVCSRNLELLDTPENTLWNLARRYELAEKIPNGFAVQGEAVGEGIQGNPLKLKGHDLFIYNVYDIVNGQYLDLHEYIDFCEQRGLKRVPLLYTDFELPGTVDDILDMAEGKSELCAEADREGIVFRPLTEQDAEINGAMARLSFKAISNAYLLNER